MQRIVLVDDDRQLVGVLKEILSDEGYKVESFEGVKFTQQYEQVKPDALIIDVWFGDEADGVRLSQALANHRRLHNTPLLLISSDARIAEYADKVKASDYLQKPFSIPQMLNKLKKLVA